MSLNEYLVYIVDRDFQIVLGEEAAKLEGQIKGPKKIFIRL